MVITDLVCFRNSLICEHWYIVIPMEHLYGLLSVPFNNFCYNVRSLFTIGYYELFLLYKTKRNCTPQLLVTVLLLNSLLGFETQKTTTTTTKEKIFFFYIRMYIKKKREKTHGMYRDSEFLNLSKENVLDLC